MNLEFNNFFKRGTSKWKTTDRTIRITSRTTISRISRTTSRIRTSRTTTSRTTTSRISRTRRITTRKTSEAEAAAPLRCRRFVYNRLFCFVRCKELVNKSRKNTADKGSNDEYPYICECVTANEKCGSETSCRVNGCACEADSENVNESE